MRKIVFLIHVSLDGFVAGTNGEMDWIVYNDEVEKYSHDMMDHIDATIYGRVTYQMMEGYWTTVPDNPASTPAEVRYAEWVNKTTKIVPSTTLDKVNWENTLLIKENVVQEINALKQQPGKNLWLLGSPTLAQFFMQHNLIDEYRINVNPVILGSGKPLFAGHPMNLKLLEAQTFKGGVVALRYAPENK